MTEPNGHYKEQLGRIEHRLENLDMTLTEAVAGLTQAIGGLSHEVKTLGTSVETWRQFQTSMIPLRLVLIILAIVMFAFAGGAIFQAVKLHFLSIP